jgi:hypothetical protein
MSHEEEFEIRNPPTHLLESFFFRKQTWTSVFCEVIDNSIDHGARSIRIKLGKLKNERPSFVIVSDDGDGCADVGGMFVPGNHMRGAKTRQGHFGVGLDDFLTWVGGPDSSAEIRSVHRGIARVAAVQWRDLLKSAEWRWPRPVQRTPDVDERGTWICVTPSQRKWPGRADWEQLVEEIAFLYSPAINRGVNIVLEYELHGASHPTTLIGFSLPELDPSARFEGRISVGARQVYLKAGLVLDRTNNPRPGLNYFHGPKVILPGSSLGCRQYSPRHIAGVVGLEKGWPLDTNKVDLRAGKEELEAAIFEEMRPILLRAAQEQTVLQSAIFDARVDELLRGVLHGAAPPRRRAKRERTTHPGTGTISGTGNGSGHTQAAHEQPGNAFGGRVAAGEMHVDYEKAHNKRLGRVDESRIWLNESIPAVARARNNDEFRIRDFAVTVLSIDAAESGGGRRKQLRLPMSLGSGGDFASQALCILGELLSAEVLIDGRLEPVRTEDMAGE